MTAADIPTTHGIPNNGFEGVRFLGYQPYDALVNWDLRNNPDKPATITPGLFTAFQQQLGLKLESTKAPVDVLVIDHVEPPTPN